MVTVSFVRERTTNVLALVFVFAGLKSLTPSNLAMCMILIRKVNLCTLRSAGSHMNQSSYRAILPYKKKPLGSQFFAEAKIS